MGKSNFIELVSRDDSPVSVNKLRRAGRMSGPFSLQLDNGNGAAHLLQCDTVVRAIPEKRLVCSGMWQGQSVFVKLYLDGSKYWQREIEGLTALHTAGIAAPEVLHAGTADHGNLHVVVLQAIDYGQTLDVAWEQAGDERERMILLERAVRTIASHHLAGLEQQDIHLDNFLLADETLYTLDGGGICLPGQDSLPASRAQDNLALFYAQFQSRFDALLTAVLPVYTGLFAESALSFSPDRLPGRVRHFRRERRRRYLKKIFRECSEFSCYRDWRCYRVHDRSFTSPGLMNFLTDPDASLKNSDSKYLKKGNASTLWQVRIDQRLLVVKRYNIKGTAHRLSRALRLSRAAVSWRNAHRLHMHGILTARPVALLEERIGLLRGRAWFVTEFIPGDDLLSLCRQITDDLQDPGATAVAVTDLLRRLADCNITHGDLKATNIILSGQGPAIIDLDSMVWHKSGVWFRRQQRRDMTRFMKNWNECPDIAAMFLKMMHNNNLVSES